MKLSRFAPEVTEEKIDPAVTEPGSSEKTETIEFPIPETLVPETLSGIKITCEKINYTVDTARNQITLLEASLDAVEEDKDISDLSMLAIVSQLDTATEIMTPEDETIIQQLAEKITSDNPYKYEAVLESLTTSISTLKNVLNKGLSPLVIVNRFLTEEINIKTTIDELNSVSKAMTPAVRGPEEIKDGGSSLKDYDLIVQAVQTNQEPEAIPEYINSRSQGESDPSITACTLISKGLTSIKLDQTRFITVSDLHSLGKYLDNVVAVQKSMDVLLESMTGTLNTEQITDTTIANMIPNIKAGVSSYWEAVNKLPSTEGGDGQTRVFDIMQGMKGVVLTTNGHSSTPTTAVTDGIGVIKRNTIVDLSLYMSTVAIRKLAVIIKQSGDMNMKIDNILKLASRVTDSEGSVNKVAMDQFSAIFNQLLLASKFTCDLTFTATQAFQSVCDAVINVARGVAILTESP